MIIRFREDIKKLAYDCFYRDGRHSYVKVYRRRNLPYRTFSSLSSMSFDYMYDTSTGVYDTSTYQTDMVMCDELQATYVEDQEAYLVTYPYKNVLVHEEHIEVVDTDYRKTMYDYHYIKEYSNRLNLEEVNKKPDTLWNENLEELFKE